MYITLFMVETALHVILCFCRYLLVIWKARYPQQFTEGWLVMRQELTKLYTRFYVPLLGGLVLFYYSGLDYLNLLVVCLFSFWVPQIIHNVHREVRSPLDTRYMIGMTLARLFLPLYFYGCPQNFLSALPVVPISIYIYIYISCMSGKKYPRLVDSRLLRSIDIYICMYIYIYVYICVNVYERPRYMDSCMYML
jgi:hypothetical protein